MKTFFIISLAVFHFSFGNGMAAEAEDGHGDVSGPDAVHFDASQGGDMIKQPGVSAMVEGTVLEVSEGKSGKATFINFFPYNPSIKNFHVVVFEKTIQQDPVTWSGFLKSLSGQKVRVSGTIKEYKGQPEIEVELMEQIEVVAEGTSDMPSQ
ncbi:MAG: hypothetical protein SGI98_05450 [Verrucomicrobiota bacterium]|nr:hypothetical protein [Verrucomicrobiota bacterium]